MDQRPDRRTPPGKDTTHTLKHFLQYSHEMVQKDEKGRHMTSSGISDREAIEVISEKTKKYGFHVFFETARKRVQEAKANPGYKEYWIERGYNEDQAQRNAEVAGEVLRKEYWTKLGYSEDQAQRNAEVAGEVLPLTSVQQLLLKEKESKVFWRIFGSMREIEDSKRGIVGRELQASNSQIADKALSELNKFNSELSRFKMPKEIDLEKFLEDFVKARKNYDLKYSLENAIYLAQERQRMREAAENGPPKRENKPRRKPPEPPAAGGYPGDWGPPWR